jgi:hypothetical protein
MKRDILIWFCFILSIACFGIMVLFGPADLEFAMAMMWIIYISWLSFIVTAIYEVNSYTSLGVTAKVSWTLGLIFLSPIVGLIYLMSARKALLR